MTETSENSITYSFGDFQLNCATRELTQGGVPQSVQRRVLDLLVYLIENRARTVSKVELQDAVWPGTVVTEAALSRAVMKARKTLDDQASEPQFIKTVHGQGYRFVGEVKEGKANQDRASADPEFVPRRRQALLRVATTYGAGAWLLNQAAAMVWEAFEWDRWPQQALLAASVVGFPLILALAWFYEFTPQGMVPRARRRPDAAVSTQPGYRWQVWTIAALALSLVLSLYWNLRTITPEASIHSAQVGAPEERAIAVLPVANLSGDDSLSWVGLGMMSLLGTQLRDADLTVVSASAIMREVGENSTISAEQQDYLRRTQGAQIFVSTQLARQGEAYVASGAYTHSDTVTIALPEFSADTPAAAVRRLGDFLVGTFGNQAPGHAEVVATGDAFVDQAFARGMHQTLQGNLETAQNLLEVAANAAPDAFWPNYELSVVLRFRGELATAKQRNLQLLEQAKLNQAPVQIAVLSNELGVIADLNGELKDSEQHYLTGLEAANEAGIHRRKAILLINYAILQRALGDSLKARELLGQALIAYQEAGIELIPGDFYITLGNAAADAGDHRGAFEQYNKALQNYREAKSQKGEAMALSNMSWASQRLGDMDGAFGYLEQSAAMRAEIGDTPGVVRSKNRRADLLYSVGRLSEVKQIAEEIAAHEYAQQEPQLLSTALTYQAYVAEVRKDYPAALSLFEQALKIDIESSHLYGHVRSLLGLARVHVKTGEITNSENALADLEPVANDSNLTDLVLQMEQVRANLALVKEDHQQAETILLQAAESARESDNQNRLARIATDLAQLYWDQAKDEEAMSWTSVAMQALPSDGRVQLAAARMARFHGQTDRALDLAQQARTKLGEHVAAEVSAFVDTLDN